MSWVCRTVGSPLCAFQKTSGRSTPNSLPYGDVSCCCDCDSSVHAYIMCLLHTLIFYIGLNMLICSDISFVSTHTHYCFMSNIQDGLCWPASLVKNWKILLKISFSQYFFDTTEPRMLSKTLFAMNLYLKCTNTQRYVWLRKRHFCLLHSICHVITDAFWTSRILLSFCMWILVLRSNADVCNHSNRIVLVAVSRSVIA